MELTDKLKQIGKQICYGFTDVHALVYTTPTFIGRCATPGDRLGTRNDDHLALHWMSGALMGLVGVASEAYLTAELGPYAAPEKILNVSLIVGGTNALSLVYEAGRCYLEKKRIVHSKR